MAGPSFLSKLFGSKSAQKDAEVMAQPIDTLQAVQNVFIYHRSVYRILIKVALLESLIALVLIAFALWIILSAQPQDRFFVSAVSGRIDRVLPLDVPLMDNNELFSRAATDIAAAMTFGYLDIEQRRIQIGNQFDPAALQKLQATLIGPGGLTQMSQDGSFFSSEVDPSRGGGIARDRVNPDFIHEWVMQVPVNVTTKRGLAGEKRSLTPWMVTILVQRARKLEINRGYIILDILDAKPVGETQALPDAPPPAPEPAPAEAAP